MEMHQVRYFVALCDTLNFTRAAERCNVTQPALTRAIRGLEDEFGGQLFRRERSRTHLTELGRLMRPHLERVLEESEAARSTASGFLKLERAAVNFGVMCTVGPLRAVGFLSHFRRAQPGVELAFVEATADRLVALLLDGALDVAVLAQPEPFHERLDARPLYRERYAVAFPAGHRFERVNAVRVADLTGESFLSRANCERHAELEGICRACGVEARRVYSSERDDWIQTMVLAGLGVCLMPEYSSVLPGLQMRRLVEPDVSREVSLVSVAGRRFSPALAALIRAAQAYPWSAEEDAGQAASTARSSGASTPSTLRMGRISTGPRGA
jgi:LysR family hydrogen peroxide-inducible transcriptional activator